MCRIVEQTKNYLLGLKQNWSELFRFSSWMVWNSMRSAVLNSTTNKKIYFKSETKLVWTIPNFSSSFEHQAIMSTK